MPVTQLPCAPEPLGHLVISCGGGAVTMAPLFTLPLLVGLGACPACVKSYVPQEILLRWAEI